MVIIVLNEFYGLLLLGCVGNPLCANRQNIKISIGFVHGIMESKRAQIFNR